MPPQSDMATLVRSVGVILCSPRSGSSLMTNILASHPDIASLDGELEPYLALTGNGFGHNSDSAAIDPLANRSDLADEIIRELGVNTTYPMDQGELARRWSDRLLLQFPSEFLQTPRYAEITRAVAESVGELGPIKRDDEQRLHTLILSKIFRRDSWRMHFYDGVMSHSRVRHFDGPKLEEPPFVCPRYYTRSLNLADTDSKVLLFKTPSDVYRIGMYETLFPNADVKYIHLTRGYAQTVNGLMDGWLSPVGFFSHDLGSRRPHLRVEGYSDAVPFGVKWWKFDMPPNWSEFVSRKLVDVCLNQWYSAHGAILGSGVDALRVSFEDLLARPEGVVGEITDYLGVSALVMAGRLPVTMATGMPENRRWTKREEPLLAIGRRKYVATMMEALGYDMNSDTWL